MLVRTHRYPNYLVPDLQTRPETVIVILAVLATQIHPPKVHLFGKCFFFPSNTLSIKASFVLLMPLPLITI